MLQVTDAIHSLIHADTVPKLMLKKVEKVFSCMDTDRDGVVTMEEWLQYCRSDIDIGRSLAALP